MEEVERNLKLELDEMVLRENIQCCVLGCTHYPLVEEQIRKLYPQLPLIDPAHYMAQQVAAYLERSGLRREKEHRGSLKIYTTGDVEEYTLRARQVGLKEICGVEFYPPMEL